MSRQLKVFQEPNIIGSEQFVSRKLLKRNNLLFSYFWTSAYYMAEWLNIQRMANKVESIVSSKILKVEILAKISMDGVDWVIYKNQSPILSALL